MISSQSPRNPRAISPRQVAKHTKELAAFSSSLSEANKAVDGAEAKMEATEAEVRALQKRMAEEEDEIFADFSKSLGIESVREYERKTLRQELEQQQEILELGQQRDKLAAQVPLRPVTGRYRPLPTVTPRRVRSTSRSARTCRRFT